MPLASAPILAYAGLRTAAALALAITAARRGARLPPVLLQVFSDTALAIGVAAFADERFGQRLGPWLELMLTYAVLWETYAFLLASRAHDHVPGDPVSVGAIGAQVFWIWETLAVLPSLLMGVIAAEQVAETGLYGDVVDAVSLAVFGTALLLWARLRPPSTNRDRRILLGLGVALWLAALWLVA